MFHIAEPQSAITAMTTTASEVNGNIAESGSGSGNNLVGRFRGGDMEVHHVHQVPKVQQVQQQNGIPVRSRVSRSQSRSATAAMNSRVYVMVYSRVRRKDFLFVCL